MFFFVQNFLPVTWHVIDPVRFSKGQYVHFLMERHLFLSKLDCLTVVRDLLLIGVAVFLCIRFPSEVLETNVVTGSCVFLTKSSMELWWFFDFSFGPVVVGLPSRNCFLAFSLGLVFVASLEGSLHSAFTNRSLRNFLVSYIRPLFFSGG